MKKSKFKTVVLDVDGVLTTGQFIYTADGKFAKVFGAHDSDGVKLLKKYLEVIAITADTKGHAISKKRVAEDMGLPLHLVNEEERLQWFKDNTDLKKTIFIGDGMYDARIFPHVGYSICPNNGFYFAKERADFVTRHNSGEGAVAEAALHVLEKFFEPFKLEE